MLSLQIPIKNSCHNQTIVIIRIDTSPPMHSTISNEFNFEYELDISQTKQKEMFTTKEGFAGFAFQDFMNVGDRTFKSDKADAKHSSSVLSKKDKEPDREQDSGTNQNILQNLSEHPSGKAKRSYSNEALNPLTTSVNSVEREKNIGYEGPSPKFGQNNSQQTIFSQNPKKEFTLRRVENTTQMPSNIKNGPIIQKPPLRNPVSAFKKKPAQNNSQQEQEYFQIEKQIHYYQDSLERMVYECRRMEEETEKLAISLTNSNYDTQMEINGRQIKKINQQIEDQKNLEAQLTKMMAQLSDQYANLVTSIKTSNFPRPLLIRDEANAIIDQINTLKTQFEAMERDDGSLNLSSTLFHQPASSELNPFRLTVRKDCNLGITRIKQIFEQNKTSADPRFLSNIKMACLRDEWNLYSNGEIHINVSYRQCTHIKLHIGNKRNRDLQKFTMIEDGVSKFAGETIAAKSYIVHKIEAKQELASQLFVKCQISYTVEIETRRLLLYIPVGLTNYGEFSPITEKEFAQDAGPDDFQFSGSYRPLDKKLMSSIEQIAVYMPNVLVNKDKQTVYGLFISPFNEYTMVVIKQRGEMVSVCTKIQNWSLLRLLEFILSV